MTHADDSFAAMPIGKLLPPTGEGVKELKIFFFNILDFENILLFLKRLCFAK